MPRKERKRAPSESAESLSDIQNDGEAAELDAPDQASEHWQERMQEGDLGALKAKIAEVFEVLADFSKNADPQLTKVHYFIELRKSYCAYFGYSEELMDYIIALFGPRESYAFLQAMEESRPTTIRLNTLKAKRSELAQALAERHVNIEPVDEIAKTCLKVNSSRVPIGATPEYLAGHYLLQSAASLLPVLALSPQINDRVLDVAAAPGGKTTHIAQLMRNTGLIVANDANKARIKALFYNCQRLNVQNTIITNYDGRRFPACLKNFDRVLLDAPCTGLGVISRDPTIKARRSIRDIQRAAHLQRELLRAAIDRCRVGGYIVYSTCSVAFEENEAVVAYACRERHVKIVDTGLSVQGPAITHYKDVRLPDRFKKCVRVLPHTHNLDGFFIAKLKKLKDGPRAEETTQTKSDGKGNKSAKIGSKAVIEKQGKTLKKKALRKSPKTLSNK